MKCESYVYLNKIFTNLEVQSCPLLGEFTADAETFEQQISFYEPTDECGCSCNCSCNCNFDFSEDLNFVIDSTQVFVNDFALDDPTTLTTSDVTINGLPVDALEFFNDRFMASTTGIMHRISNCDCLEKGASTKAMFLIRNAGPWVAKMTFVIRGSVFGCGGCKKFKLVMTTREGISIDIPGCSTFAVTNICLPCTTGGIAPILNFSFIAKASLLNPVITTDTSNGSCNVFLSGALVTEPAASIQVTRQTLFAIDAEAVSQQCDDLCRCKQNPGVCTRSDEEIPTCQPCCECDCTQQEDASICCQFNGCNGCSV